MNGQEKSREGAYARPQLRGGWSSKLRESLPGYALIAPALILIFLFGVLPIFYALFVSLHQWRIKQGPFVGLRNYEQIFGSPVPVAEIAAAVVAVALGARIGRSASVAKTLAGRSAVRTSSLALTLGGVALLLIALSQIFAFGDRDMLDSVRVTVWYSLGTVPVQLSLGLGLAVLLDRKFRGRQAFRVMFLLPYIVPSVASAAVFERILSLRPESFANQIIALFRAKPLQWLYEPTGVLHMLFGLGTVPVVNGGNPPAHGLGPQLTAYLGTWAQGPSLALVSVMIYNYWVFVGYYALIFLNGLAQIPKQLYDAAEVDGAGKATIFWRIIVPLLSPSTYFLSLIGIIGTFKAFNHIYILRSPAAQGTIDPMSVYIFFTFFRMSRFGYAAALSLLLFAIILILTLAQRRFMERRVFYGE
ncbi:MAG TPA: sugar ABC transporter permease [Spirochaetia bacterium]|nr:sugar ABC transporter permease [Spirochaetia bacterium]